MLRRLEAFLMSGVWFLATPAAAQESTDEFASEDEQPSEADTESVSPSEPSEEPTSEPRPPSAEAETEPSAPTPAQSETVEPGRGWQTFISGYFRAPLAIGISPRPDPSDLSGPARMQLSYGPTRTMDSSYYSFGYTRLQEQDWAEIFFHAKKKHIEAVVGWMGYWYQAVGFRNPDASWGPGMAYLVLDSDFRLGGLEPNIELTAGAFWPSFGYFEKYDTYTLGRFRQLGEQVKLTVPLSPDLTVTLVQGFGGARDGSFIYSVTPLYAANTGLNLVHFEHAQVAYQDVFAVGLHYNSQWTRDPRLFERAGDDKNFVVAREARVTTLGAEAHVSLPRAGRLWVSPSYIRFKNGWALANGGVEVMHSLGGEGLATNYAAFSGSLVDTTGSGSLFNVGFLYENSLSGIRGQSPGTTVPDVTLNVFGLFTEISRDLPAGSRITQPRVGHFKYGADLELQAFDWLALMLRFDEVEYNLKHAGYVFNAITSRLTLSSHFLSGESIYIQYSRYRYGDKMVLAGTWPWGSPIVAGTNILQAGSYSGDKPDMDVVRLQASVAF